MRSLGTDTQASSFNFTYTYVNKKYLFYYLFTDSTIEGGYPATFYPGMVNIREKYHFVSLCPVLWGFSLGAHKFLPSKFQFDHGTLATGLLATGYLVLSL